MIDMKSKQFVQFEAELKKIFDEKFISRVVNLKKTGNIFSPMFYLVFTRLVELSSIINNVVLPNKRELTEMFQTRKEFLQLDYNTINETIRRMWVFEMKRDEGYNFTQSVEDLLYIVYRMKDVQEKIDRVILNNIITWDKEELAKLYFILIKVFLEVEEDVNRSVGSYIRMDYFKAIVSRFFSKERSEKVNNIISALSEKELLYALAWIIEGKETKGLKDKKELIEELEDHLRSLNVNERLALIKIFEAFLIYNRKSF